MRKQYKIICFPLAMESFSYSLQSLKEATKPPKTSQIFLMKKAISTFVMFHFNS